MRFATVVLVGILVSGVGSGAHAQRAKSKAKGKTAKANTQVSAEMKDFLSFFHGNGDGKKTDAALAKYSAKDADVADMTGSLSVENARVLKSEKSGDEERYTIFAQTGEARRTFLIVWKDRKIQQIKQLSVDL